MSVETNDQRNTYTFNLELPNEDYIDICKLAGSHGITVDELLENFAEDLVGGRYSNGSDERMHARQWFDRCWFGMFPEDTFLKHLIDFDDIEDFVEHYRLLKECEEELLEEAGDEKEVKGLQEEIDYQQKIFKEYYDDYADDQDNPESYEDGVSTVMKWWDEELNARMNSGK